MDSAATSADWFLFRARTVSVSGEGHIPVAFSGRLASHFPRRRHMSSEGRTPTKQQQVPGTPPAHGWSRLRACLEPMAMKAAGQQCRITVFEICSLQRSVTQTLCQMHSFSDQLSTLADIFPHVFDHLCRCDAEPNCNLRC